MVDGATRSDDWLFLFYVPYANDLWHVASCVFGSISSAFARSARDSNRCRDVRVLLQYKLRGDAHMRRRHWYCDSAVECGDDDHVVHVHDTAKSDLDASCISSFESFLSWASGHAATAAHIGVAIMGHGGGVMQICPEEVTAGSAAALRWMDVGAAAAALKQFNDTVCGRIGLVFLQNCCKSTLHALWPLRHLHCCVVASPTIIAAPNTYYSALIHHLFTCPTATPASAAASICASEQPQDFAILSVFSTANLLPFALALERFAAAAAPLLRDASAARAANDHLRSFWIEYGHTNEEGVSATDHYVDIMAMCAALQSSVAPASLPPHLLHHVQVRAAPATTPAPDPAAGGLCRPANTACRLASRWVLPRLLWAMHALSSYRQQHTARAVERPALVAAVGTSAGV